MDDITNLTDDALQCRLNYLSREIQRKISFDPHSKEIDVLDDELRAVLHERERRSGKSHLTPFLLFAHINISLTSIHHSFAVATFQRTLSSRRNRRNGGSKLLMSKKTQLSKKKAAAEAAGATRASLKSDVTTVETHQVQESSLTCTSLKPDESIERPTKVLKSTAGSSAKSTTTVMSRPSDTEPSSLVEKDEAHYEEEDIDQFMNEEVSRPYIVSYYI